MKKMNAIAMKNDAFNHISLIFSPKYDFLISNSLQLPLYQNKDNTFYISATKNHLS